jgi:hypothetical protein
MERNSRPSLRLRVTKLPFSAAGILSSHAALAVKINADSKIAKKDRNFINWLGSVTTINHARLRLGYL